MTYSGHSIGSGSSALAISRADMQVSSSSTVKTMRRRSTASAKAPPYSPKMISGRSSATPSRPTASVESVSS